VIGDSVRAAFLPSPADEDSFEGRAIVFDGRRIITRGSTTRTLEIDERSVLFMRNCGPVGYPGSAEVVNMTPPIIREERHPHLPCTATGAERHLGEPLRSSMPPEAAIGGGLALLRTGDRVRVDLKKRTLDVLIAAGEARDAARAWTSPCSSARRRGEIFRPCRPTRRRRLLEFSVAYPTSSRPAASPATRTEEARSKTTPLRRGREVSRRRVEEKVRAPLAPISSLRDLGFSLCDPLRQKRCLFSPHGAAASG